ncbi:hypothetical protein [Sphingobacterium luzhongxinii]|uniref:hypothetical protein n=1 Tax=Sphingobacterium luzhongxinii TaxID=2654181 RepID=UPI0013D9FBEA|nr:hypothetical protein [Sphingobacterium sp. xlx-73]
MTTLLNTQPASHQGWRWGENFIFSNIKYYLFRWLVLFTLFLYLIGKALVFVDPAVGVLDLGVLTVAVFGLLVGVAAILCSLWLQELLWQPFKVFRQHFNNHFNQLTAWQQCILYFSVFFLLLYAGVMLMGGVL